MTELPSGWMATILILCLGQHLQAPQRSAAERPKHPSTKTQVPQGLTNNVYLTAVPLTQPLQG